MSEHSHEPVLEEFPCAEWDDAADAVIVPVAQARAVAEWLLGQDVDYCSNVTLSLIHISEPTRPY